MSESKTPSSYDISPAQLAAWAQESGADVGMANGQYYVSPMRGDQLQKFVIKVLNHALEWKNNEHKKELTAAQAELREARERAGLLFSLLLEWQSAFHNRGETTSIHEWNERMKQCDEETSKVLSTQRSES